MKLNKTNQKGFTLIELMIIIAIIGILAAIAIPNFISYRDKPYCSAAEADANRVALAIADYFSVLSNVTFTDLAGVSSFTLPEQATVTLSLSNTVTTGTTVTVNPMTMATTISISIAVTDVSGRCPLIYQVAVKGWAANVFTKTISLIRGNTRTLTVNIKCRNLGL